MISHYHPRLSLQLALTPISVLMAILLMVILMLVNSSVFADENSPIQSADKALTLSEQPDIQNKKPAPPLLPDHSSTGNILNVTFGLFVVLIFIALTAWAVRRFGNFQVAAKGNLKVVGGLHMGARERVVLIQVGEQQLLIGVAPGRIQTLHVLSQPLSTENLSTSSTERFSDKLVNALKGTKPQ